MAVLLRNLYKLNTQLHSLLIEKGVSLTQKDMDTFISIAHRDCLSRLQHSALSEGLIEHELVTHDIHQFIDLLKNSQRKQNPARICSRFEALQQELDQSIINEALALAYRQHWQSILKQQANNYSSLWGWLTEQCSQEQALTFLEQWGCIGHPYHPNFRAKTGFNSREVIQYSPEFNAQVSIHWAAVHGSLAFTSIDSTTYRLLFVQHFSREYELWSQCLQLRQLDPDHFLPLPVHPWQWDNKLEALCGPLLDSGQVVLARDIQNTRPSMSFRTMVSLNGRSPHLKLATAIHTTSALRTVSPASVSNSSLLSEWINRILVDHHNFNGQLFLARDLAGINVSHSAIPAHEKKYSGMLVRENPLQFINESQKLVPLAALFSRSSLSQKPLLIEIIEASSVEPKQYFIDYCKCVLESQLHLLLHYGVALEAHQQNTLIVFQDDRPTALVIRDLGGIKICFNPVYDQIPKPLLHPESTITCSELDGLSNTFIHGNLLSNLSPWIECLSSIYGLSQESLWNGVRRIIQNVFDKFGTRIDPVIHHWYLQQLLINPWQQKSLLRMRLNQDQDTPVFFTIDNPLSEFNE